MVTDSTTETHAGPLRVFLDGESAGVTVDEMTITYEQEVTPITTNEFGQVDSVVTTNGATVSFNLAQLDPDVLALAIPGGTLTAPGTYEVGSTRGLSLLGTAKRLTCSGNNGVNAQEWTFPKAYIEEGSEITYGDPQASIPVTFRAIPNPDDLESTDALVKYDTYPV